MRVLLATTGTAGDVHPFIAIGLELRARGHEVVLVANPYFQARAQSAGLGFWPTGNAESYRRMVTDPALVAPGRSVDFVYRSLLLEPFRQQLDAVAEAARVTGAQVALAHHICFGALAACELIGLPTCVGVLAPMFWLSRHERIRLPVPLVGRLPLRAQLLARRGLRLLGKRRFDAGINALRSEAGLHRLAGGVALSARGDEGWGREEACGGKRGSWSALPLALWSPRFRAQMPDDPSRGRICGFAVWDRPAASLAERERYSEIAAWMKDGEAPVLVTLGSSVSHHGARLYLAAAEACARLNKRALLLTGVSGEEVRWPKGVRAVDYVPYSIAMPLASCVVHHAGIGTTAGVLRSGRPAVIVPFANDEFDNADRVARSGFGVVVAESRSSTGRLARRIAGVCADSSMQGRCATLRSAMIEENGAARAADALEELCG